MKLFIRTTLLSFLLVGLGGILPQQAAANDDVEPIMWEKYSDKEGNFSVNFPKIPTVSNDVVETEVGEINMKSYMCEISRSEAYMVAYSDYPEYMLDVANPNVLLDGGVEGALGSLGVVKPEQLKDIKLDGKYPGKYFKANNTESGGTFYAVYRMFLVNNRLYQVAILKDGEYPSSSDEKKFMESFTLLSKPDKSKGSGSKNDEAGSDKPSKTAFSPKGEGFSLNFPGEPTTSNSTVPTELGDMEMYTAMYEKSVSEVYMLAYSDYPPDMVGEAEADALLDGGKEGAMSSLGITQVDEEKDITVQGYPGKYFKATNGTYYVVYKMCLVKNRLYQVAILREGTYPSASETKKFLDSFQLDK